MNGYSPQPPLRYCPQPPHYSTQQQYASQLTVDTVDNNGIYRPVPQRSPLTKVFGDVRTHVGGRAVFDCVLLGSPRPKVCWLFNDDKLRFTDLEIVDTSDMCRLVIPYVQPHHYGTYTVLCENEVGRAVASAQILPL